MGCAGHDIDDSIFTLEYPDSIPPLSRAVKEGDLDKIKKLLSKGSLPHAADNRGWTAIHCCAAFNQLQALKLILKLKSKSKKFLVNLTTWENVTPLLIALKAPSPSFEMVEFLLKSGASAKLCTHTNLSPLHLACLKKNNLNIVKLLIKFEGDVNVQEDLSLSTPLHFAVNEAGDLQTINYLLNKSNTTLKNVHNRNPFLEACHLNFFEAVQLFIKNDKNLVNIDTPIPPLSYAAAWGNLKMAKFLIESGANVNCVCKAIVNCKSDSEMVLLDTENYLPIHSSLTNLQVFKLLLELTDSSCIWRTNTDSSTFPLFVLVYAKDVNFFEELLQSDKPEELKCISCQQVINFILACPNMAETLLEKFSLLFKYNFYFEPENVFRNFVCLMSEEELQKNYKFLYLLAQMGVSSVDELVEKNMVINRLECLLKGCNDLKTAELIRTTCNLLLQPVLSLKQLSRIAARRYIKAKTGSNWLAVRIIQEGNIVESLKKFLFFDATMNHRNL